MDTILLERIASLEHEIRDIKRVISYMLSTQTHFNLTDNQGTIISSLDTSNSYSEIQRFLNKKN